MEKYSNGAEKSPQKDSGYIDWVAYDEWEGNLTHGQKKAILDGEYPAGTPEWIITVHLKTTQEEKLLGGIFRAKYDMTLADLEARDVNTILDQIVAEDGSRNEAPRRGRNILDSLSAIQRTVFSALYALEGMRCMTKQEVAQQLAISLEEVDRIEEEAYRIIQFGN